MARYLQKKGIGLLLSSNPEEAWQVLQVHGSSIDLAIIHREGTSQTDAEPGLKFLARVKADPTQQDLPVIITSGIWRDVEFARHQQTSTGANAYLSAPFKEKQLIDMIEAVLGQALQDEQTQSSTGFEPPTAELSAANAGPSDLNDTQATQFDSGFSGPIQLEEVTRLADPHIDGPILSLVEDLSHSQASEGISLSMPSSTYPEPPAFAGGDPEATRVASSIDLSMGEPSAIELTPMQFESEPTGIARLPERPAASVTSGPAELPADDIALKEMSYLFDDRAKSGGATSTTQADLAAHLHPAAMIGQPIGDAVVPGGASQAPDTETLKRYLMLREQDVSVLSSQLRTAEAQIKSLEGQLSRERSQSSHLGQIKEEQDRRLDGFERDKRLAVESVQAEIAELTFQLKARSDKAKAMEYQVRDAALEMERLKERVRVDIRKIRVREKELENRLEIVKKDSEALIGARETKIIELKRKLDILEFNLDLLQNQYNREKENSAQLRDRLAKAAQVVKVAGGLLLTGNDHDGTSGSTATSGSSGSGANKVKSGNAGEREAS